MKIIVILVVGLFLIFIMFGVRKFQIQLVIIWDNMIKVKYFAIRAHLETLMVCVGNPGTRSIW